MSPYESIELTVIKNSGSPVSQMHQIPQTITEPDSYKNLHKHSGFHIDNLAVITTVRDKKPQTRDHSRMTVDKSSPFPNKQVYDQNQISTQKIKIENDDYEKMAGDVKEDNKNRDIYYDDPKMQTLKSANDMVETPVQQQMQAPRFFG